VAICDPGFAFANEEEVFVVEEAACGVLEFPEGSDRIYGTTPVDFTQEQEFNEDEQIRASASRLPSILGLKNPGSWSFTTYVKPSGAAGTPPEHRVLFKGLFGDVDEQASYVDYTLANQVDPFSLWVKKGHTVFAMRGCTVESGDFSVAGDAVATVGWGGAGMELLWAGEAYANDTCGLSKETITMAAAGATRFVAGMKVVVGDDDNSGDGYLLSGVNYTNNTITISPALGSNQGTNPLITPWWPTSSPEVGEPGHGKLGLVTIGGQTAIVFSASVTVTNNIKYYINEKNNVWTAERYGRPGRRAVEGTLVMAFVPQGSNYFYRSGYKITNALVIPVGNVAGKIMEISIPYAEYRTPTIGGAEEFQQTVPFVAVASATLNDEIKVRFR